MPAPRSHGCGHTLPSSTIPDVITYRLDDSLVYVKPLVDYNEAIDLAIREFPDELLALPRHRLSFTIQATMNNTRRTVRISESAWEKTVHRMVRGEVIAIEILPEDRKIVEAPPQYLLNEFTESTVDLNRPRSSANLDSEPCIRRQPSPSVSLKRVTFWSR